MVSRLCSIFPNRQIQLLQAIAVLQRLRGKAGLRVTETSFPLMAYLRRSTGVESTRLVMGLP